MSFEDSLLHGIPLIDGADFFTRVKTAGWNDPPDLAGELEGQFSVPVEQVIHKLKSVLAAKARLMLAWYTYAQSLKGEAWRSTKDEFYEHAADEKEGFEFYLKRASVLGGGPVHFDEIEPPPASSQPQDIFTIMARAEQEGIAAQRELRDMVGEDNPMRIGIEEHLLKDQHHLDEMWQMMPQGTNTSPVIDQDPEGGEPVEDLSEEAPEVSEVKEAAAKNFSDMARQFKLGRKDLIVGGGIGGAVGLHEAIKLKNKNEQKKLASSAELIKEVSEAGKAAERFKASLADKNLQLKAKGKDRAVATLAAEAHRKKGRRGARAGSVLGGASGIAGGIAMGGKYLRHPAGKAVGAGLGYLVGSKAGKELGTEVDIAKNASLQDMTPEAAQSEEIPPGAVPPEPPAVTESQGSPLTQHQAMEAANYLGAEAAAREAEEQNAAEHYKNRLHAALSDMSQMEQQVADAQNQLAMVEQQAAENAAQVGERTQQAVEAEAAATAQAQQSANLKIGIEKMRQQLLDVASQDPESMAQPDMSAMDPAAAAAAAAAEGASMDPGMEGAEATGDDVGGGDPSQPPQPDQEPAPGAVPAGAGTATDPGKESQKSSGESNTTVNITAKPSSESSTKDKTSAGVLPWAALGGALGAGDALLNRRDLPKAKANVESLDKNVAPGDFAHANRLAKAYERLGKAEESSGSPTTAALKGGAMGAALLGLAGPRVPVRATAKRFANAAKRLIS